MADDKKRKLHRRETKTEKENTEIREQNKSPEKGRVKIGVPINREIWRRLRALSIMRDCGTGKLLDEAIENYLNQHK